MMKILMTAMTTSISEVMETMFYLPVEVGEEATLTQSGMDDHKAGMACRLSFSGDVSGRVTLLTPKALLSEVTENFMGESIEHLENEHLLGTFTEMLNMICGNALSRVDSKKPFELGIPEIIEGDKLPGNQLLTIIKTRQSMMAIHMDMD